MNKLFKLTFITLITIFAASNLTAQTTKFGHINSAELLSTMPEIKEADKKLQDFGATLEAQLKTMTNEYQTKVQSFQGQQAAMAEPIKDAKVKEISDLEARIQEFQQTAQESVTKKKEELYSPILKKAENAIVELAKEKGYSYVFDTSAGALIYSQPSDDLMEMVKKKLGILASAATPSAVPVTTPKK